ncbi:MAG: TetR/AcrR family transcriptional regulator [Fusicatenibacter sp.]
MRQNRRSGKMGMQEDELPTKVKQIYEAVLSLMEEGADINALKVSDITTRAGIGKGTAYEYFENKEEIIGQAILYNMENAICRIRQKSDERSTFSEKFLCVLEWMDEKYQPHQGFVPFIYIFRRWGELPFGIREKLIAGKDGICRIREDALQLAKCGMEEGVLRKDLPDSLVSSIILSSIAAYAIFLGDEDQTVDKQFVREFICEKVIRDLS